MDERRTDDPSDRREGDRSADGTVEPEADAEREAAEPDADESAEVETEDESDDREWRFALDEVGEDAEEPEHPPLEPGSPDLENVVFVLAGAIGTLAIFLSSI